MREQVAQGQGVAQPLHQLQLIPAQWPGRANHDDRAASFLTLGDKQPDLGAKQRRDHAHLAVDGQTGLNHVANRLQSRMRLGSHGGRAKLVDSCQPGRSLAVNLHEPFIENETRIDFGHEGLGHLDLARRGPRPMQSLRLELRVYPSGPARREPLRGEQWLDPVSCPANWQVAVTVTMRIATTAIFFADCPPLRPASAMRRSLGSQFIESIPARPATHY